MNLVSYIDHTLLKPNSTSAEIRQLCQEAMLHQFNAVCIPPYFVNLAVQALEQSSVKIATVIGFPLGYAATAAKVEEIKRALDEGVDELDVVVNNCAIQDGNWNFVRNDIDSMTRAVHLKGKTIKIILETNLLQSHQLLELCDMCGGIGVDFVKTSTGFNGGASVETIEFLKKNLPASVKIKASGGIRTFEHAKRLIAAGADRLGSSSSLSIIG